MNHVWYAFWEDVSASFDRKHDFPTSVFKHTAVKVELIFQSMVNNAKATLVLSRMRGHTSKSGEN